MSGTQRGLQPMLTPQMASAARNLAAMGSGRDTMLAHINPQEARILMQLGGKGNTNPRTGLPQFDEGGGADQTQSTPQTEGSPAANNAAPTLTPTGQFPTGQTWASLNAADPNSGGVAGLWQDPNSQQWYNPSGALAPLDPGTAATLQNEFTSISPVPEWDPIDTNFAGGGFIPQPGDANFTLNPAGDYVLTPTGEQNIAEQYGAEQSASVEQQKRSEQGGLLPLEILGGVGGLIGGVAGLGALGAFGGAADAAADATGDITAASLDAGAAADATGDVTAAALGPAGTAAAEGGTGADLSGALAADAPSIGSGAATTTAGDLGIGTDASVVSGDVTGSATSLADLGASPSLSQLAAATPDSLVGDASDSSNLFLGGTTADSWDVPAAADASAPSVATDAGAVGPSTDLSTLDTAQFPGGYIVPPDPATGLTAGEVPYTAAAGGGTVAGGGGGGSGIGNWFSTIGSKLETGLTNDLTDPFKLLGLGAAGVGLLHSLSSQSGVVGNVPANETALTNLANQTTATGEQLQGYLTSGTLPPGLMQQVNQATAAAIQQVKAKYAANGVGPNSTPEQQDINTINQNVPATIATIGQQLLTAGTADLNIAQGTLNSLLTANTTLNNQTNQAIANLARALSGGGTGNQQFTLTPNANTTTNTAA